VSEADATLAAADRDWEALARAAARGRDEEAPVVLRELLVFELGESSYAIPVDRVREIVRVRAITPIPHVPADVRGVIVLRGEVAQVVDLRMCLGLPVSEHGRRTRIVVLHGEDDRVAGLLVDAVHEVMRVPEDDLRPVAEGEGGAVSELFLKNDDFVSILALDRVLDFHGYE
jgi:purine-binding chemotaxis protein CheW